MTSTEPTTTAPADSDDREVFGIGEPCGVCHYVTGRGQICGNTVYANSVKGRLPLYCGQPGQAEWQEQHGTPGDKTHRSDLATYPRKRAEMDKEDVAKLAAAEAARRGITRRHKVSEPTAPVSAPAETSAAPAGPVTVADLSDALPESPVEALAELARLVTGRVVAVRREMDEVRAGAEARAAEIENENAERTAELDTLRAELESDREEARQITEQARSEIRAANDAQLRIEGELNAARERITALEQALTDAENRHRAEVAEVREREEARYDRLVAAFAATRPDAETSAAQPDDENRPVTEEAVQTMAKRVERNEITQRAQVWYIANSVAPRPAAAVLARMQSNGYLHIGSQGQPERVTLTDAYRNRSRQ